jgi:hypothetical protein
MGILNNIFAMHGSLAFKFTFQNKEKIRTYEAPLSFTFPAAAWFSSLRAVGLNGQQSVPFWSAGPYYPLGTTDTVPRAYQEMEGRKIKVKKLNKGKCNTK